MKIRDKLFLMIATLLISIVVGIYIIGENYLEKFYIKEKVLKLEEISSKIKDPSYLVDLDGVERRENVIIYIKPLTEEYIYEDLEEKYVDRYMKEGVYKEIVKGSKVIEQTKFLTGIGEYLVLYEKYSDESYLEVRTPISSITEAVTISNSYYFRFIGYVVVFGFVLAFIISRRITKPIIRLKGITRQISELNFDIKFKEKRSDELGELGQSVNKMGGMLKSVIEELNLANEKLKKDIEHEKKLESLRKEFVASVSHELKTPIALIQGYAQGLSEGIAKKENRDFYCEVIVEESKKIDLLVKELLLISQIEAGYLKLKEEELEVKKMLEEAIERFSYEDKALEVRCNLLDESVIGDEKYIQRVIDNLVGNAFKYCPEGGVINISTKKIKDNIEISVKNSCEDITPEEIGNIWTPFYRMDKSRNSDGTGLGLSIVKGILDVYGSRYSVDLLDKMIEFKFTLKISNKI